MKCTQILRHGATGETMDDETPSKVCLKSAVWVVYRSGVRPKYRCDEHVAPYRELGFDDIVIEPATKAE